MAVLLITATQSDAYVLELTGLSRREGARSLASLVLKVRQMLADHSVDNMCVTSWSRNLAMGVIVKLEEAGIPCVELLPNPPHAPNPPKVEASRYESILDPDF